MKVCVTVEGSPRVNALPSSSSTWMEMSHKSNPVSLLPYHVYIIHITRCNIPKDIRQLENTFRKLDVFIFRRR
jgi:hypothetical protein